MSTTKNIQLRDARDRLTELLALGQPYPLRDLPVPADGMTVPYNQQARIPVDLSQLGVLYQLHTIHEEIVTESTASGDIPVEMEGTGDLIHLETPNIMDDASYKILAMKIASRRKAYLHTFATVKVGLDTALLAWIRNQPLLDSQNDNPQPDDPRLCDYGDTFEVEISASQEGVDYKLVHFVGTGSKPREVVLSVAAVRGTDGDIVLQSQAVYEDTVIRIRATKTFDPAEGRQDQMALLDIALPIKVKARRDLAVSISAAIVSYGASTSVRIAASQSSALYRVYAHQILDPEIVHEPAPDTDVLRVQVQDEPEVQVRRPALPEPWQAILSYIPASDFVPGTGRELVIDIDNITDDAVLIIEASKPHHVSDSVSISSYVWLEQALVVLARPDPAPAFSFNVYMQGKSTDGRLIVVGGQPGVFYFLGVKGGDTFALPAYIHKRDALDSDFNKGINQLEVGIDFAIAADHDPAKLASAASLAVLAPEYPSLDTGPLAGGTIVMGRAMKAQTRIEATLTDQATIMTPPAITLSATGIDRGAIAKIQIAKSQAEDSYQLMSDGKAIGPETPGNGADIVLESDPLSRDTGFEVHITRPAASGIPVRRIISLQTWLKPDAGLTVTVPAAAVKLNDATLIQVAASENGVEYQLIVADKTLGDTVPGNGLTISLPTGPLTADTTFTVHAYRIVNNAVSVDLTQQVTVTIITA